MSECHRPCFLYLLELGQLAIRMQLWALGLGIPAFLWIKKFRS